MKASRYHSNSSRNFTRVDTRPRSSIGGGVRKGPRRDEDSNYNNENNSSAQSIPPSRGGGGGGGIPSTRPLVVAPPVSPQTQAQVLEGSSQHMGRINFDLGKFSFKYTYVVYVIRTCFIMSIFLIF